MSFVTRAWSAEVDEQAGEEQRDSGCHVEHDSKILVFMAPRMLRSVMAANSL